MNKRYLFLTGKLAEKSLHKVLSGLADRKFDYEIRQIGVSVAALMTTDLIARRLKATDCVGFDKVILPGRCRGDIEELSKTLGLTAERGPEELKDIPQHFGHAAKKVDLSQYSVKIFGEIVDAPNMTVPQIIQRAERYRTDGANVIDLGCLPNTPFGHLAETVQALKNEDFKVSVDSLLPEDLVTGGQAGADYLLSLQEASLWVLEKVDSTPIVIGTPPTNLRSLYRTIDFLIKEGVDFIADPILDPINFNFTESIVRYRNLRKRYPDIQIMMGVGNLTELTHADSAGINAILMGIISELDIQAILATEVSEHCRKAIREADLARRIMHASREDSIPPKGYDNGLMALHERKPFPYEQAEILEFAEAVKDPNFRIQVCDEGVFIYNRDGIWNATDPFDLYPHLSVSDDAGHAFYLGCELARAQIAWQLGKRYDQDEELTWGVAVERDAQDLKVFKDEGSTMKTREDRRAVRDKKIKDKKNDARRC
jgi:dihydropteroate synthase